MAVHNSGAKSLQEYLKRYESNDDKENKKKKKKIKKAKPDRPGGVMVVDEDPVWQKPVKLDEEEDKDSADEERPQVEEDIEVKRMKRLEQLRLRRGYNAIAEDGSGWVSLPYKGENVGAQNSDISPPRRQRAQNYTPSLETGQRGSDADRKGDDLSPPRQRQVRHYTPSPESHDRSAHTSSPRKPKARKDTPSPSPPTKDPDLSPPRKKNARNDTPPVEDTDMSPPLRRQRRHYTPSPEHGQDSDMSPPRRTHTQKSESSFRKKFEAFDAHSLGSDLSPSRKNRVHIRKSESPDLSLPRLTRRTSSVVDVDSHAYSDKDTSGTMRNRKDSMDATSLKEQPKTGLVTARDIQEEISKAKKNDLLRFEQMDPSISGRGAEPVYRDKKGQRISKEEYMKSKQKVEEKPKEKKLEWGKGLAQKREVEARLQELELEKDKPFARTRDDPELDKMLKERLRWGDPMAHLVKKKHHEPVLTDLGDNEKMKESGFIVPQEIPNHSWIKRGLDAAPNRHGIKPGRHWDGVDRSNGFEKKMFQRLNEKRATEKESYLWSVSDM